MKKQITFINKKMFKLGFTKEQMNDFWKGRIEKAKEKVLKEKQHV